MNKDENNNKRFNTDEIDEIIIGRVKPHIYAFSTNTIPNYLKIGDTYRPVKVRLDEWRQKYSNLSKEFDEEAMVSDDTFFRDYAVHSFLENDLQKQRLTPSETPKGEYYSNEFFKEATADDIKAAIQDIKSDFEDKTQKYQYYNFEDRPVPIETEYKSTGTWTPRPNQKEVINNFKKAINKGRTKLLLYAVMRFGKTFTSMCCANEINAKIVLVVSAKADVKEEWRMTIQSADNFDSYVFIDSNKLKSDDAIIKKTLDNGKKVVIFLTLQDLKDEQIKDKHKEVFSNKIDLLLVDETHFGARAEVYGRVLRDQKEKTDDFVDFEEAREGIKVLHPHITIHLSGTPYRILMSSEFEKNDIIGFYQASDILDAKKDWDEQHFGDIENQSINPDTDKPYQEWDNPYFGFPQMIRFAFTPSKRIRSRLEELQRQGIKSSFDEVFKPKSTKKQDDGRHKEFVYSDDILEFLRVIDGEQGDDSLMSFLDYDKIKDGSLCHHIVFVLPFRASCDAMQKLIEDNSHELHNLKDYEIINISGVDCPNQYSIKDVKRLIKKAESESRKTITLTVNRMLTGSTVPEWDTMIYLKDTRSPQEYDQAIFRLQNQFTVKYKSKNREEIVKYDKKPQTILVDFSPNRLFSMQEERALVYNANIEKKGRNALIEQIEKDLSYSPIITLDNNRMKEVTATDLLSAIDNYSKDKGIYDEAQEIPIDLGLLNDEDIRKEIEKQGEFKSRQGFEMNYGEEDDEEIETPAQNEITETERSDVDNPSSSTEPNNYKTLERQFKTYYSRILFYAALTDDDVTTLKEIIGSIDKNDNNNRISKNLELNKVILQKINDGMDAFALYKLDNTISRINKLSNDESLTPLERAQTAIRQFDRLSKSEIVTPQDICNEIINIIGDKKIEDIITGGGRIIDIASKKGEFALSIVTMLERNGIDPNRYKDAIYSVPTSNIAYEFTRKIYKTLQLNIDKISKEFNSYDILKYNHEITKKLRESFNNPKGDQMKFEAIVGNPPYQEETAARSTRNGQTPRKNIFQYFQETANLISDGSTCLIYPGARWIHRSGKGMAQFGLQQINDERLSRVDFYPNSKDIFTTIDVIPDGISIVYKDIRKKTKKFEYVYHDKGNSDAVVIDSPGEELIPLNPKDMSIVKKVDIFVKSNKLSYLNGKIFPRSLFGIESNFVQDNIEKVEEYDNNCNFNPMRQVKLFSNDKAGPAGRAKWYIIDKENITHGVDYIGKYKVVVSSAHPGGQEGRDNCLEILDNYSVFGRSRVALKIFDTKKEAENYYKYCKTPLVRFMFLMTDESLSSIGKRVPDFITYTDSNTIINFDNDINEQLCKKIGLSKDEQEYIEKVLNKKGDD